MSRYEFESGRYRIVVGFDGPLQSLFGSVHVDGEEEPLLDVGNVGDQITTVPELQKQLTEYGIIPPQIAGTLRIEVR